MIYRLSAKARRYPPLFYLQKKLPSWVMPPPADVQRVVQSASILNRSEYDKGILTLSRWINSLLESHMERPTSDGVYNPTTLKAYDEYVWEFNSPFLWRIEQETVQALYDDAITSNGKHLEIAVGTGLFLDGCTERPRITLLDLNDSALDTCKRRLSEIKTGGFTSISAIKGDILDDDLCLGGERFDSVGANFLLHCLHGPRPETKKRFVSNCAKLTSPTGTFFGTTILGKELENAGPAAQETSDFYNSLRIFDNLRDNLPDLSRALHESFEDVEIHRVGYCAIWKARIPKL